MYAPRVAIRKIARIVDTAMKDADLARKTAHDPAFRQAVSKDRRAALSSFRTVKQALRDRERIEKEKAARARKKK